MFLKKIEIDHILPCLADPEKLRFVAYLERDISGVLPYLNALLPGTNCRQCGEPACLAFAVKLAQEQAGVMDCRLLFSGDYGDRRAELFRLLQSSGYRIPAAFAEVEEDKL